MKNKSISFNSNDSIVLKKAKFNIDNSNTFATKVLDNNTVCIEKENETCYNIYINDKQLSFSEFIDDLVFSVDFFIEQYEQNQIR